MRIKDIKPRGGLVQDRKPTGLVKDIKAKMIKVDSSELGLQTTTITYNDSVSIIDNGLGEFRMLGLLMLYAGTIISSINQITYSDSTQVYGGVYGKYGEPPTMKGVLDL